MQDLVHIFTQYGLTEEILLYMLYIPLIATVVNLARYVVGMKMFGIYAPMTLAFAYIFTGVRFGILVTIAVILATLVTYSVLRKVRMHYLSRIAINYILITVFIIGIIALNEISPVKITSSHHDISAITPLGVILITTLSDFFIRQFVKKDLTTTLRSLMETVVIGLVGWWLLTLEPVRTLLLTQIWVYPVLLVVNILAGQYAGLRLKDFSRFKRVVQAAN